MAIAMKPKEMNKMVVSGMNIKAGSKTKVSGLTVAMAIASLALGFIGCGEQGADPTAKYSDLNAVAAPHNQKARSQAFIEKPYIIEPEKDVTFIAGEARSFKVRVKMLFPVDSYSLNVVGLPEDIKGLSMVQDPSEPGAYMISWTAPKEIISTDRGEREIEYRLELSNIRSSDSAVEALFRSVNKTQDFSFRVRRTGKTPEIVDITKVPSEVNQGSTASFTVDVQDPASYDGFAPRLDVYFQGTNRTEAGYVANGATYVRSDVAPKHMGQGVWRFSFVFDAQNNDVGAQLDREGRRVEGATHLQTRLFLKAYSSSGGVSVEKPAAVKVKFAVPQVAKLSTEVCEKPAATKAAPVVKPAATAAKPVAATKPAAAASKPAVAKNEVKK